MLKRFTSVILSLCIVATLFAGLNFSAFAAASDAKDNTVNSITSGMEVEATRNEWLTNNGYEPSKSIIKDYASSKAKVYYYICSKEENPEIANVNTLTYGQLSIGIFFYTAFEQIGSTVMMNVKNLAEK